MAPITPTTTAKKPAHKLKRVLKSAARFPVPLPRSLTSARSSLANLTPLSGELPLTNLRLQVLSCTGLLAKDRNGASDPYVVVSVLNNKHQTPVAKRTLNPLYTPKDATFDFPIYLSLADRLGVLELVVWDKDYLGKDYLGEAALPLDDWFTSPSPDEKDRAYAFDDAGNTVSAVVLAYLGHDRC
jgi:phosphatidylserine decarboxylase